MSVDLNKASMLLHIVSKARDWPNLQGLHDIVMAELEDMSREAAQELAEMRAEAKAKADVEAAEKAAAKIEADAKSKADEGAEVEPPLVGGDAATTSDSARRL